MLRLCDIMRRNVLTLTPSTTVREAIETLADRRVGGAPVVEDESVLGVVTVSDLLCFAAGPTIAREAPATSTAYFTEDWQASPAPGDESPAERLEIDDTALEGYSVTEAMSRAPVHALPPGRSVAAVAEYMRQAKIERALVMSMGRFEGTVSRADIARAATQASLETRSYGGRRHPDRRRRGR